MTYRREIDGLRAVAVIPVILFHAGFTVFSGGYVGVDVFFVISGYLITRLILAEMEQGHFSLVRFYERRARRILPALFFVMLCCIPFAWMWMLPAQFKDFSQSIVAVLFFASNVLFWKESGYFAAASEQKPLLHTWSLAVEEQYYVLFPLLMILLWRFGRRPVFYGVMALCVVSFLLSEWGWRNAPAANFYLAPTRAWELLAGSLCALMQFGRSQQSNNLLAGLGLGLIGFSIFAYDAGTPFPSAYTLAPVAGTVLIVLYGAPGTWVARFLSLKACVGIGLISYSAYLWHQPLFAFARIRSVGHPEPGQMLLLAAGALVLAFFSWRYIEQPFRRGSGPLLPTQGAVFGTAGFAGCAFLAFGLFGHMSNGIETRATITKPFADLHIEDKLQYNIGLHSDCEGAFTLVPHCATGPNPQMLLWGDSHAMHLAQALTAADLSPALRQHTMSACPPLLNIAQIDANFGQLWAKDCITFNDQVYDWLRHQDTIEYVVLSSQLGLLSTPVLTREGEVLSNGQLEVVLSQLAHTVTQIRAAGKKPVLVSPPPATGDDIGMCLFSVLMFEAPGNACDFTPAAYAPNIRLAYAFMARVAEFVPVVMLDEMICPKGLCDTMVGDTFVYRDKSHLTKEGSHLIGATYALANEIRARADLFWDGHTLAAIKN